MLSDAFPPRQRGRALGLFSMAVYAGGGIALVLGGVLLLLARRLVATMSAFRGMDPWHLVFLMVGALGVPMEVLMAQSPHRQSVVKGQRVSVRVGFGGRGNIKKEKHKI